MGDYDFGLRNRVLFKRRQEFNYRSNFGYFMNIHYKLFIYAPDDDELVSTIITAAASAGAGQIGNYSHCAFVHRGWGQWKTGEGATPFYGTIGETSRIDEVKIEMRCPANCAAAVRKAVTQVHPFEEVNIEFIRLEIIADRGSLE